MDLAEKRHLEYLRRAKIVTFQSKNVKILGQRAQGDGESPLISQSF